MTATLSIPMNPSYGRTQDIPFVVTELDREERDLILRCQRGEKAAFEPIVTRYMRRAAAFALGWVGNRDDALDLSQEAFARAYRAIHRFDADRPFYPWFHRILRNLCINHIGRSRYKREIPLEDAIPVRSGTSSPQEDAERSELRKLVWEGIARVSEQDREILILREFQDLSYTEIADVLDIPKGTVMSRLHNARRRLRDRINEISRVPLAGSEEE
ncbi:MAG: sigma-70 family RNA polymerase sigma factor [Candidatus Eisenbacteria bacterium]|uniref:Sigma-70 family RNA polymerase sigma factor n=1 Tax=Eiseniibacteriota bacterium TaxID=2212470 RepID=A0A956N965_UNCEI|nr:sigma-70 family RNA polymerase sigma factor [Candidatus Eisenbacteria bacterium]MCB9465081.1 sigma-70 family RNA polymerase sigma factor [Candidatus Eisenbacteria bacterium]